MKFASIFLGCILLAHLFLLTQSRFTVWPEMILYPWLNNNGYKLYVDIINPYFPLLTIVLSAYFKIFEASIFSLKLFTYVMIIISDIGLFISILKISRSFLKATLGLFIFILLHLTYGGNGLWFELVLSPLVLASLVLIYANFKDRRVVFLVGALLSICFLIKQNSAFFYLPVLILLIKNKELNKIPFLVAGSLIAPLLILVYLLSQNLFYDFLNWGVLFSLTLSSFPGFILLPSKRQLLFILFLFIPILLSGIKEKYFWILASLISVIFVFPRYEDFHLQVLVILSAFLSIFLPKKFLIIFLIFSILLFGRSFTKNWQQEDRFLDREMYKLSESIKSYDSVYLLNSPELAYFFANKYPPKPWATNYPWYFKKDDFEERFISEFDNQRYEYVIIGDPIGGGKYDLGNYIPERLDEYIKQNYKLERKEGSYQIWHRR